MGWTNPTQAAGRSNQVGVSRWHRVARVIIRRWRQLTDGGGPTLVACSGGADSSALALAIHAAQADITLAHVVHDIRPEAEALADRDAVARLAHSLGVEFVESRVEVGPGNIEASARDLRYDALERMAHGRGIRYIATAHHADDQLETILMGLLRGAGPRGLRGVAASRRLGERSTLIRPMLDVSHADAEAICLEAGWAWQVDRTNQDLSRLRAALRHGPLAELARLSPQAGRHAARTARLMGDVVDLLEVRVRQVFGTDLAWKRSALRQESELVLGEGLRAAYERLVGREGLDRLGGSTLNQVVRAIRDESTEPRRFHWTKGCTIHVTSKDVRMEREGQGS